MKSRQQKEEEESLERRTPVIPPWYDLPMINVSSSSAAQRPMKKDRKSIRPVTSHLNQELSRSKLLKKSPRELLQPITKTPSRRKKKPMRVPPAKVLLRPVTSSSSTTTTTSNNNDNDNDDKNSTLPKSTTATAPPSEEQTTTKPQKDPPKSFPSSDFSHSRRKHLKELSDYLYTESVQKKVYYNTSEQEDLSSFLSNVELDAVNKRLEQKPNGDNVLQANPVAIDRWKQDEKRRADEEQALRLHREQVLASIEQASKNRRDALCRDVTEAMRRFDLYLDEWESTEERVFVLKTLDSLLFPNNNAVSRRRLLFEPHSAIFSRYVSKLKDYYVLNGHYNPLSVENAVLALHDHAATLLCNWNRSLQLKFKMEAHADRCALRKHQLVKKAFKEFVRSVQHQALISFKLRRKFVAWGFRASKRRVHREIMAGCFFPFFIWRRVTKFSVTAKRKAYFLRQVYHTVVLLTFFRPWRQYTQHKIELANKARSHRFKWDLVLVLNTFRSWKLNAMHQARVIRAFNNASKLHRNFEKSLLSLVFTLWKYYQELALEIRNRSFGSYHRIVSVKAIPECAVEENESLPRLYDMPIAKNLKRGHPVFEYGRSLFREAVKVDKRETIAIAICFKRLVPRCFTSLKENVVLRKKNRFASYVGGLCIKKHTFAHWVSISLYREQNSQAALASVPTTMSDKVSKKAAAAHHLDWKSDIEWRRKGIENATALSQELESYLKEIVDAGKKRKEEFQVVEEGAMERMNFEQEFLLDKERRNAVVVKSMVEYGRRIKSTKGKRMHDTLHKVLTEHTTLTYEPCLCRSVLHRLRLPVMERKTTTLLNRSRIKNWLRICARFRIILKGISSFRKSWVKYKTFEKWIRFIGQNFKYETPGLSASVRRQQYLLKSYDTFLTENDAINESAYDAGDSCSLTLHGTFLRWMVCCQLDINYKRLVTSFKARVFCRKKLQVFNALKLRLKPRYVNVLPPYEIKRAEADMARIKTRIFVFRHKSLASRISRVHQWILLRVRRKAAATPNMKLRFASQSESVRRRLLFEKRLMFKAFNERHVQHYRESNSTTTNDGNELVYGKEFKDKVAPSYYQVTSVIFYISNVVEGIQTVRSPVFEGKPQRNGNHGGIATDVHGSSSGEKFVFEISSNRECLTGFQIYRRKARARVFNNNLEDAVEIDAIRCVTSTGRVSDWYGTHRTIDQKRVVDVFRSSADQFVTGLYGTVSSKSNILTSVGLVLRTTTKVNLFAGMWRKSKSENSTTAEDVFSKEFTYFLQLRSAVVTVALCRTQAMVNRAWKSSSVNDELCQLNVLMGVGRWFLNSLTYGLVAEPPAESDANNLTDAGLTLEEEGRREIARGKDLLGSIEGVDSRGNVTADVSIIGTAALRALQKRVDSASGIIKSGMDKQEAGRKLVADAESALPSLPLHDSMKRHIQELYGLVQTRQYVVSLGQDKKLMTRDREAVQRQKAQEELDEVLGIRGATEQLLGIEAEEQLKTISSDMMDALTSVINTK